MLGQIRRAVFVAFLFSGCINILMLAMPLYTLQIFENVVPVGSVETLFVLSALIACSIAALAMVEIARDRIMLRAGTWIEHELGQHILDNGLKHGATSAELISDARALMRLRAFLTSPAINPLFDAPFVPLFVLILVALHPLIGLLAAGAAGILLVIAALHTMMTERLHQETAQSSERAEQWWTTVAGYGHLCGALGIGHGASGRWEWFNRAQIASSYSLGKRSGFAKVLARTVRLGAQSAVYGLGAWLVIGGELTPGALVASAILISRVVGPIEQLVGSMKAIRTAWGSYRRLKALPVDAAVPEFNDADAAPAGAISLNHVVVHHPGRKAAALRGITLDIAPGSSLAIVGPNGAGKSTLAAVISGAICPTSGSADLDGLPVYKWQRWDGLPPVGFAPDEPALLEGSVHENIARFREASLMSVGAAALKAGVHGILQALPDGYDAKVGPQGRFLSLSERRAVALARAFHGTPCVVVLDEPEAGLDGAQMRTLMESLGALKASGTGIVIATQDPRLIRLADNVAVLAQGSLVSLQPAASLLKSYDGTRSGQPAAEAVGFR